MGRVCTNSRSTAKLTLGIGGLGGKLKSAEVFSTCALTVTTGADEGFATEGFGLVDVELPDTTWPSTAATPDDGFALCTVGALGAGGALFDFGSASLDAGFVTAL
jgi:hypothetical protein